MIEPTFTLKATDPAAATALRAYIDCARRQGAMHSRITELNDILLSFSTFSRQPPVRPTQPLPVMAPKGKKKERV